MGDEGAPANDHCKRQRGSNSTVSGETVSTRHPFGFRLSAWWVGRGAPLRQARKRYASAPPNNNPPFPCWTLLLLRFADVD